MCGIAGFLTNSALPEDPQGVVRAMTDRLTHRGPDSQGYWWDPEGGVALGHRRLAIIDLSAGGAQPMSSRSARYLISFNGEIYNFQELRGELLALGHQFRGGSDTEVILAAVEQWGLEQALRRLTGMFAFALWDSEKRTLFLARDRVGEKPLYYGQLGDSFLFASELKALKRHPCWRGELDPQAVHLLFRYTYIPAPHTVYAQVRKLEPGSFLEVRRAPEGFRQTVKRYWSVAEAAAKASSLSQPPSEAAAVEELERLLAGVVRRQMLSDVPLGAFLSGGIDSSTIVALMQAQSDRQIKTFSIGFNERRFNEAQHAKSVARHLGTDHTEFYVTEQDALDLIPTLPEVYDEPFADSSQIPTCLLARLARQQVTVALSGDGGDELFFGYQRYHLVQRFWRTVSLAPAPLRRALAAALDRPAGLCRLAPLGGVSALGYRLGRFAELFGADSSEALYEKMTGYHGWAESVLPAAGGESAGAARLGERPAEEGMHMMLVDLQRYLPDDILVKVDRAAMTSSLETRVPFLDHTLVEHVLALPLSLKYRGGTSKYLLRQVLYRHVPRELVERPKMGFGVPIEIWLRGPLREWGESLLSERALLASGLINPAPIRQKWREHQAGRLNWRYELWPVLMFQAWLEASG